MAGAGNPNMVGMTKPGMLPNAPAAPVAPALSAAPAFSPQMSTPFGGMLPNPFQAMPAQPGAVAQPMQPDAARGIATPQPAALGDPLNGAGGITQYFQKANEVAANTPTAPMRQPTAAEIEEFNNPTQFYQHQAIPSLAQSFGGPAGSGNVPPSEKGAIPFNANSNVEDLIDGAVDPTGGLPYIPLTPTPPPSIPAATPASGGKGGGNVPPVSGIDIQPSEPGAIPPYANPGFDPTPTPTPPPPPSIAAAPRQPNINQTAADGINQSIAGAGSEMNYQPNNISPSGYGASQVSGNGYQAAGSTGQGYDAAQASGQGFNAANVGSTGYGSTNAGSTGYGANNVQAGQIGDSDLSRYMNQYDSQVIDNTLGDMDRARQMQQQSSGANATAAGAFGGSRHALRESENNRNYYDQAAKTTSALRQAGFNNAQQMGLTDLQSTLQASLANQGANNAASQFGASAANTAGLTNAAAANRANEFGASAFNQAAQQYSAQQQAANQFGAQAGNTANLANQAAFNQANQFGAQAANNSALANQASLNQARQFGAQAKNTAGLANQSSFNQANQFNATQNQNAQLANQAAGLSGSQQRLAAGRQLGDLSNLGFGMGQQLTGNLAQDGAMKQGINQLLIDAARNQYSQYQSSPYDSIGLLSQALGASPVPQTTNTSKTPGLFDYLTLGAGMKKG